VAVDDGLLDQRAVKQPMEISAIRQALKIQRQAFRRTLDQLRPGQTENQVAAFLEYQMRLLGADGASFPTIAAADANAALPHAIPGPRKLRRGGILLIDWGARFRGYCGDLTRVVALGKMPPKLREVYKVVLDAQLAAIDAVGPGKRLKDIDAVARCMIEKAGYGEYFGHGLGHGIGLDIHEQPVLSRRAKGELRPGHVVTVEPGIYLPGVGGVRIEDDVLVTARGRQVLSDLPKSLESAII
jgi:Xaa-Pro aminopeptidase